MPTQTSAHNVEPATRQSAPPAAAISRWLVGEQHATVTRPFPEVVRLLHDIRSLEEFEPKADHVVVHAATSTSGTYRIRGRLGPLPLDRPVLLPAARTGLPQLEHRLPLRDRRPRRLRGDGGRRRRRRPTLRALPAAAGRAPAQALAGAPTAGLPVGGDGRRRGLPARRRRPSNGDGPEPFPLRVPVPARAEPRRSRRPVRGAGRAGKCLPSGRCRRRPRAGCRPGRAAPPGHRCAASWNRPVTAPGRREHLNIREPRRPPAVWRSSAAAGDGASRSMMSRWQRPLAAGRRRRQLRRAPEQAERTST
jgi:hypothetical protein